MLQGPKPPNKNLAFAARLKPRPFHLLALALAVLGIGANHAHDAAAMNDLALHANLLDRSTNLHENSISVVNNCKG
jgi:hypothetical protein